jgi:hypothetical protein
MRGGLVPGCLAPAISQQNLSSISAAAQQLSILASFASGCISLHLSASLHPLHLCTALHHPSEHLSQHMCVWSIVGRLVQSRCGRSNAVLQGLGSAHHEENKKRRKKKQASCVSQPLLDIVHPLGRPLKKQFNAGTQHDARWAGWLSWLHLSWLFMASMAGLADMADMADIAVYYCCLLWL